MSIPEIEEAEGLLRQLETDGILANSKEDGVAENENRMLNDEINVEGLRALNELCQTLPMRWNDIWQKPACPGVVVDRSAHEDIRDIIVNGCQLIPKLQSVIDFSKFLSTLDAQSMDMQVEDFVKKFTDLRVMADSRMSAEYLDHLRSLLHSPTSGYFDLSLEHSSI